MSILPFFIILIVVVILIAKAFFSNKAIVKRKLRQAEVKKIANFLDGYMAKIVGTVEFVERPLTAPLSGRTCAYFYVKIEEKVSSGKSSHWKTIIEDIKVRKFVVREGKHVAYIDDRNLESYIVPDWNCSSGFLNDATDELEAYLYSHGHRSEGMFGMNKTIRYSEGVLEEEEEIAVYGKGNWEDAERLGLPAKYGKVLVMTSHENEAVYFSDDPTTTESQKQPPQKEVPQKEIVQEKTRPPKIEPTRRSSGRRKNINQSRYRK